MQDKYAGDAGDFGKFILLKKLEKHGLSVGVNWYKTEPKVENNNDGKHTADKLPDKIKALDKELADKLSEIASGKGAIEMLEKARFIDGDVYWHEPVTEAGRGEWHKEALTYFREKGVDVVFLDPDNGVKEGYTGKKSVKHAFYGEVRDYINHGRSVIIYNHRSRKQELEYFTEKEEKLRKNAGCEILEITFPRFTVRDYFAVAKPEHAERIRAAFNELLSGKYVEAGLCQKPLTMDITYSEYFARFRSVKNFFKHYQALPEEFVREMITRCNANNCIKACMVAARYKNRDK